MIKRLIGFTLHLLIFFACLGGFIALFLHWTGYYEHDSLVAYLYDNTAFHLIEIDQMSAQFATNEVTFESAPLYGETTDRVAAMIEKGANTIILNLTDAPSDALIALAVEHDITLLFVGALPSDTQIASYDKLWCFTSSSTYAGELLGEQVAAGYRDETIADENGDLLLDFVFYNLSDTYLETEDAIDATLLELDHYGVYTTDLYAVAYSAALATAEQAFELERAQAEASAEESAAESTDEADETTGEDESETEDSSDEVLVFDASSVTVSLAWLTAPEVAMSIGFANAEYLADKADLLGWRDGETPTTLACIVENYSAAETLAETGLYHSIVYFDTATATELVVAMACNAWAQTPVTNGTTYAETTDHTFVVQHLIYKTAS